jgi:hypothetical protein
VADTSDDRAVKAELLHRLKNALELECKTKIPTDDKSRASQVTLGKYTGEIDGIILSVHGQHPLGFRGRERSGLDEISGPFPGPTDRAWKLPVESVGGSHWQTETGTVQVRMLSTELGPADSVAVIEKLKARIARVILTDTDLRGYSDEFGNRLFALDIAQRYGYASGGDNTSVYTIWCDFVAHVSSRRTV